MSSRPNRRSHSVRRSPNTASSVESDEIAALPQQSIRQRENSIRTYFSPLSHDIASHFQPPVTSIGKPNELHAKKANKTHVLGATSPSIRPLLHEPTTPDLDHQFDVHNPPLNGILVHNTKKACTHLKIKLKSDPSAESIGGTDSANGVLPNSSKQTRTLRSKDGCSRLKSELATYFANFEDIISDAPKPPEYLSYTEPLYIVDEPIKAPPEQSTAVRIVSTVESYSKTAAPSDQTSHLFPKTANNTRTIPLSSVSVSSIQPTTDPLSDHVYFKPHRRAERKEKQLRNIEKERAMHEKVQLERLGEALQGPDWLRVMGVTGITEGEQKDWKAKREYFICEVNALVERFRSYREEEKRLLQRKECAREEEEEEEEEDEDEDESEDDCAVSSDVDISAARQLLLEAGITIKPLKRRRPQRVDMYESPSPQRPFVSFYAKPHLRAAAMGSLRSGRKITAFGQPIPDFKENEFSLPDDFITPDAIRANARKRRRMNRESKEAGGTAE